MPTYGYRCKSCDHTFEVVQSVNDDPIKICPKCKGPVSKLFFPVGIAFKGSGFYTTDYKNNKTSSKTSATANNNGSSNDKSTNNSGNGNKCSTCKEATSCTSE